MNLTQKIKKGKKKQGYPKIVLGSVSTGQLDIAFRQARWAVGTHFHTVIGYLFVCSISIM